jgi:branched-subunit amino acid aminotransferase/4-amino-4-deoxychorismate lyase
LRLEPPRLEDLPAFAEAFITSASRGVLPLRQIDQTVIGTVCPGPLTRSLIQTFQASIEELTETI